MDSLPIYHYVAIFVMLVGVGVGVPPLPEEIPVVTAGLLVGHPDNHLRWWIMLPVCIVGVVVSDGLLYGIGRCWGRRLLEYRWVKKKLLPPDRLREIEDNFHKYGVKILLFARMLPGIRAPIFITAGIMRLRFAHFLIADGIYAIPGVSLLFFLGFWFTDQFMEIVQKAESMRPLIVVVVVTAFATWLATRFWRRPVTTGAPEELPLMNTIVVKTEEIAAKTAGLLHTHPSGQAKAGKSAQSRVDGPLTETQQPVPAATAESKAEAEHHGPDG